MTPTSSSNCLPGPGIGTDCRRASDSGSRRSSQLDPEKTFRVGLIYGPSGCGKSSLVKAGLLPRLAKHVMPVYIEATPEETESRLLKGLRKDCPELPPRWGWSIRLAAIRRDGLATGQKVLLVLDQFEQWLHANEERRTPNWCRLAAMRRRACQAVVMVRDDFWLAASRFMRDLEIDLILRTEHRCRRSLRSSPCPQGAEGVRDRLRELARANGRHLQGQNAFLDQAIAGLTQDGKIISVRLALLPRWSKGSPGPQPRSGKWAAQKESD